MGNPIPSSNNRSQYFEGLLWLIVMVVACLLFPYPANLPASWLMSGFGVMALLRLKKRGLVYVLIAAAVMSGDFCLRNSFSATSALWVWPLVAFLVVMEIVVARQAILWLESRRHTPLLSQAVDVIPFCVLVCLVPGLLGGMLLFALLCLINGTANGIQDQLSLVILAVARNSMGLMIILPFYWCWRAVLSSRKMILLYGWALFTLPLMLNESVYFGVGVLAFPAAILVAKLFRFPGIVVAVAVSSLVSVIYSHNEMAAVESYVVSQWMLDSILYCTTLGIVSYYSALAFEGLESRGKRLEHLVLERTSDLELANQRLKEMASVDPLTGLANRRQWNTRAELAVAQVSFLGEPMSVLLLDLDHFKRINDKYGHDGGDQVLKEFAVRCRDLLRTGDTFARLGGEEFSILLPGADLESANIIAQKIITAVREEPFVIGEGQALSVTTSIGVAEWRQEEESIANAMKRADRSLYQAKHNGRDQVVLEPYLQVSS